MTRSTRALPVVVLITAVALAACSGTTAPKVETGAAPNAASGTSVVGTSVGTTPGTTPGTTVAPDTAGGDTTISPNLAGNGLATTSSTASGANPNATQPTTPGGGPAPTSGPGPTTATTAATTTTTTAPKPTLNASGPGGDNTVHCMGGNNNPSASATWSTANATQVAVAIGNVPDAFAAAINGDLSRTSGSYPVTLSCTDSNPQVTTVTAMGPGGKTTKQIIWTMHHM